nr:MAG TPA: hypothetical protein [Caudoviricetes sp.]
MDTCIFILRRELRVALLISPNTIRGLSKKRGRDSL